MQIRSRVGPAWGVGSGRAVPEGFGWGPDSSIDSYPCARDGTDVFDLYGLACMCVILNQVASIYNNQV
jgi:hypothetical protein